MKKILSVLMSLAMVFCAVFAVPLSASANTKKTAVELGFNQSVSVSVNMTESQSWLRFTAPYTGYFEFFCHSPAVSGMILGSIYDASDEVLMMNASTAGSGDFITAAELQAGDDYYFVIETDGTAYTTLVTARAHNHAYTTSENYPAIYDINDNLNNCDGGNYTFCAYCSSYVTNALYYYPAKISIKKSKFTYDGKKKTNTITIRDRLGNVIPASNYKVTYKNNLKPGKATVTITFNNTAYSGKMTRTFLIIPKKAYYKLH